MKHGKNFSARPAKQRGAVLIVSLLILVVLTLIGLSGMQTATLEEKMSANLKDRSLAFQASELAITSGERWITAQAARPVPVTACGGPPCDLWELGMGGTDYLSQNHSWWQTNARLHNETVSGVNTNPRFIVEERDFVTDSLVVGTSPPTGRWFYRITSRGTGGTDISQVIIQTTFVRRY